MIRIRYILFILVIQTFLIACTERIDFDLHETGASRLVVFGEITNEVKAHAIYLSKSVPYFYNEEVSTVSNALVTINDGTETVELYEDSDHSGVYTTPVDYAGVPGKTYLLKIENVDINNDGIPEIYFAETVMKNTITAEGIHVMYNHRWKGWEVELFANEPGDTKDFYLFKVYKNGILYSDTISNYRIVDDKFFNGKSFNGAVVQYFDEDRGEIINKEDVVTLEIAGITEEYYDFIYGLQQEVDEKIPIFSGPAANVKGNISNGALGFFAVIALSHESITYMGGMSQ